MGKIKKILENELVGGTQSTDVYPVTSIKAVYDENNERLDHILNRKGVVNISTNYNDDHIAEVLTLSQAIAKVPSEDRVLGFQGNVLTDNGWITYKFIGTDISQWSNTQYWINVLDSSMITQESGNSLNAVMSQKAVTDLINQRYQFMGVATPDTNPGTPDGKVFYIASESGTYINFDNITIPSNGIGILYYSQNWQYQLLSAYLPRVGGTAGKYIKELVLIGPFSSDKKYRVSDLRIMSTGGVRLYIQEYTADDYSDGVVVTLAEGIKDSQLIILLGTEGYREYRGYAIVDMPNDDTTVATGDIDLSYSNFEYNAIISGVTLKNKYLELPTIAGYRIKEIYLYGDNFTTDDEIYIRMFSPNNNFIISKMIDGVLTDILYLYQNPVEGVQALKTASGISGYAGYILYDYLSNFSAWEQRESTLLKKIVNNFAFNINESPTIKEFVNSLNPDSIEIAKGNLLAFNSAVSEQEATVLEDDASKCWVGYTLTERDKLQNVKRSSNKIVIVNHDDCAENDYVATRKIYNKYNFKANFNYIVRPFASLDDLQKQQDAISKLIKDGHTLGFHAILGQSFFMANPSIDVRPDLFPSVFFRHTDANTDVGEGKNKFGVDLTGKLSNLGFVNLPPQFNYDLSTLTKVQWVKAICCYNLLFSGGPSYAVTIEGLDLDNKLVKKTVLGWLEYWYNELIDNTLGYSPYSDNIFGIYKSIYDVPEGTSGQQGYLDYYPDEEHQKNGKIVYYKYITDELSQDGYQACGMFTRGLFKGRMTCRNIDALDRVIDIAKAFMKHYFGVDNIRYYNKHGVKYISDTCSLKDANLYSYIDNDKTYIMDMHQQFYHTGLNAFVSIADIFKAKGFTSSLGGMITNALHEGECVHFKGGYDVFKDAFSGVYNDITGFRNYLSLLGTNPDGSEDNTYDKVMSVLSGQDNWAKFIYENAGQNYSNTYIQPFFKRAINMINHITGSGMIPVLTLDTIRRDASISVVVELMLRYLYENGYDVKSSSDLQNVILDMHESGRGNLYVNPTFQQPILRAFGGVSTSPDAYVPEGHTMYYGSNYAFEVSADVVNEQNVNVLKISGSSLTETSVYGWHFGKYKFSFYLKGKGSVNLYSKKLMNTVSRYPSGVSSARFNPLKTFNVDNADYQLYEFTTEITPALADNDETPVAKLYQGYQNAICRLVVEYNVGSGNELYIAMPQILKITD